MAPIMAAALRGGVALVCLTAFGLARGESFRYSGWPLIHGTVNALIFAVEFVLFYTGARMTTGSHMSIFINMAPFYVAVGAHYLLPNDQLHPAKVAGLVMAFLGVVTLFSNDILVQKAGYWRGDVLVLLGAGMWAATTIYIKRTMTYTMSPFRVLYIQILVSTPVLLVWSLLMERDWFFNVTIYTIGALLFQSVVVVFFTYMMWLVLLKRFSATSLQSFTFLTPVWGVFFGIMLLGEEAQALMMVGIALVGLGLYLINRPRAAAPPGRP
jgi:drug/metabolite transporter (DMT)-like permease